MNLPDLNKQEIKHVDATPDGNYALRILRAYRENCNVKWANSANGAVTNPLFQEMNRHQDERAKELDSAIAVLQLAEQRNMVQGMDVVYSYLPQVVKY